MASSTKAQAIIIIFFCSRKEKKHNKHVYQQHSLNIFARRFVKLNNPLNCRRMSCSLVTRKFGDLSQVDWNYVPCDKVLTTLMEVTWFLIQRTRISITIDTSTIFPSIAHVAAHHSICWHPFEKRDWSAQVSREQCRQMIHTCIFLI